MGRQRLMHGGQNCSVAEFHSAIAKGRRPLLKASCNNLGAQQSPAPPGGMEGEKILSKSVLSSKVFSTE